MKTESAADIQNLDWTNIPVERLPDGTERQMIWGERLTVCRLRFAPRIVTTPHSHPHEQMTIVQRGRVLFTIENEQRIACAGDVLHFPPNVWHGAAILDEEVVLIDVFSPVREDFLPPGAAKPRGAETPAALDLFRLDGRVALITGASRGLGAAMSSALAAAGADVALHARNEPAATAADISEAGGRRVELFAADLEDSAAAERLIADAISRFGRIDILVNNAGIIRRSPAAEHADEDWNAVLEVNLSSVFRLCRAAGRRMLERRQGKIINIASMLSFQGGIGVPSYAAAKGGVMQLTKALANEWAPYGINVNAIAPGYMETDNTAALRQDSVRSRQITERIPAGRWGTGQDLAGAVIFLASRASDYVHGHVLAVDGGWLGR